MRTTHVDGKDLGGTRRHQNRGDSRRLLAGLEQENIETLGVIKLKFCYKFTVVITQILKRACPLTMVAEAKENEPLEGRTGVGFQLLQNSFEYASTLRMQITSA